VQFTGPVTVSPRSDPVLPTAQYVGMYGASLTNPPGWDAFSLETSADGTRVTRIALDRFACGSFVHEHFFSINVNIPIVNRRFATQVAVSLPDHTHSLKIDGAFFDADGFGGTTEQALGGLIFIVGGTVSCPAKWWATSVSGDADNDGWSDAAEQRLGSHPQSASRTPEHKLVPTTPLYGPDSCHDSLDNDDDDKQDVADPGCQ